MQPVVESIPPVSMVRSGAPMKALLQSGYGSSDVLAVGEAPRPSPKRGEVLVKVQAAGVDRGTWHLMTGRPYLMRLMGFGFSAPKQPVPGLDLSGTVVEVGEGVDRLKVGDVVFGIGRGSFAQYACAREDKLARVPSRLTPEQCAVLAVSASTALQALTVAAKVRRGERVLIIGASGGVGTYAVQLAVALGARVTAVCSGERVELIRSLGAHEVIDRQAEDFTRRDATFDVILDLGGGTALARLRRLMTPEARLVFVGNEHGGDWTAGFGRQFGAALLGLFVKQRFITLMVEEHFASYERLAELVEAGQLTPVVDRVIGLEEVPQALNDLERGRVRGKIAVKLA